METLSPKVGAAYKYLLRLLASVIHDTKPERPDDEIQWNVVFNLAKQHSVLGMLVYAVEKLDADVLPSQQTMEELRQIKLSECILESNIQYETENLVKALKSKNVQVAVLKGIILKDYYPVPSMRSMSDVDILYRTEDKQKVKEVFRSHDYKLISEINEELNYRKQPFHHYEMHPRLIALKRKHNDRFMDVWDNLRQPDGCRYSTLSLEETYVYMLQHLAGHLENAGAGIRMIMDVYLFLAKEKDNLNYQVVDKMLAKLELTDFCAKISALADNWFLSGNPDTESKVAQFILASGTFGCVDKAFLQSNIRAERKSGKKQSGLKYLFRKIFPTYSHICARFISARKLKFLYPFYIPAYWCLRLFKDRNVTTANIGKYFVKTDSDQAVYLLDIMEEMGLSSRI